MTFQFIRKKETKLIVAFVQLPLSFWMNTNIYSILFNLELQKEPEESEKFKDLKKKFPELIIDIKKIYCRVCMTEFTIGKLLESNINQHMNSIEHGNKKRKRSYVNSKNVSSFFTITKVKKVKTKV